MALGRKELGQRIAQAREDADLTQQELAERIGLKTGQSISRYERGETEVRTRRLERIAEETRKPMEFFIGERATARDEDAWDEVLAHIRSLEEREERNGELLRELLRRLPGGEDAGGEAPERSPSTT